MSDLTSKYGNPGHGYKTESSHHITMLDVRPSAGGAVGFPYSCLDMVQFIPPETLRLIFADCEVSIDGDHLLTLYEYFVRHSVAFIQVSSADSERGRAIPFIKRIEIKPPYEQSRTTYRDPNPDHGRSKLRFRFHPVS
jgi:hypothetical protein